MAWSNGGHRITVRPVNGGRTGPEWHGRRPDRRASPQGRADRSRTLLSAAGLFLLFLLLLLFLGLLLVLLLLVVVFPPAEHFGPEPALLGFFDLFGGNGPGWPRGGRRGGHRPGGAGRRGRRQARL